MFADQDSFIKQNNPDETHGDDEDTSSTRYSRRSTAPGGPLRSVADSRGIDRRVGESRGSGSLDSESGSIEMHRVTSPWDEGSVTWNTINRRFRPGRGRLVFRYLVRRLAIGRISRRLSRPGTPARSPTTA